MLQGKFVRALMIPEQMQLFKNSGFCYNDRESQNIWLHASHCEDVPEHVIPQLSQKWLTRFRVGGKFHLSV